MKLIETRGTGIRLIYDSCKKAGLKQPVYHEDGDFVKLQLFFEPDANNFATEEKALMQLLKSTQQVSAQQVASFLSVSRNTAIRKLNQLISQGKVRKTGQGAAVKYTHSR